MAAPAQGAISNLAVSGLGAAGPDVDVSGDGSFIALTYYRVSANEGGVHIKSSDETGGWVTTQYLGTGTVPRLAFDPQSNNIVYVAWIDNDSGTSFVKSARCTLTSAVSPACTNIGNVIFSTTDTYEAVDITVDSVGRVHVVWNDADGDIGSSVSTTNGSSWSSPSVINAPGNTRYIKPAIAFSSGALHLIFAGEISGTNTQIEYRKATNLTTPIWNVATKIYSLGSGIFSGYDFVDNPSIVASGLNVFAVWEAHSGNSAGNNDNFGLMGVTSTDGGSNWSANATHIPSRTNAGSQQDLVESRNGELTPIQEQGLQPSVALNTATTYTVVWQERTDTTCG